MIFLVVFQILETCVKNCGKRFHLLVAHKDFLQELIKIIGPKNDPPQVVQEKILSLIQVITNNTVIIKSPKIDCIQLETLFIYLVVRDCYQVQLYYFWADFRGQDSGCTIKKSDQNYLPCVQNVQQGIGFITIHRDPSTPIFPVFSYKFYRNPIELP